MFNICQSLVKLAGKWTISGGQILSIIWQKCHFQNNWSSVGVCNPIICNGGYKLSHNLSALGFLSELIVKAKGLGYGQHQCVALELQAGLHQFALCKQALSFMWCQTCHSKFPAGGTLDVMTPHTSSGRTPFSHPPTIKGCVQGDWCSFSRHDSIVQSTSWISQLYWVPLRKLSLGPCQAPLCS